jgi:phenylacetate-CoA ligase
LEKRRPLNWTNMQTSSEHLAFPAFFNPAAGPLIAYLTQLMQTQHLPGREMFKRQLTQLSIRLQHARQFSPYFAPLLKDIDFKNPKSVLRGFNELPLLTRSILQDKTEAIFTKSPARHGETKEKVTSGSTGQPVKVQTTAAAFALRGALTLRAHWCQGVDFNSRLAAIRANVVDKDNNPIISEKGGWGRGVFATGPAGAMSSSFPVSQQLEWLNKFDPHYMLSYPSVLAALLEEGPKSKPKNLKGLLTLGETVGPELRETAKEVWGLSILDRYSSEELGMIAVECQAGQYHLMSESLIIEILNEKDRPCRPGEIGRVVATDLHNFATALIRYDLRDFAEVGTPCACGLKLPTLKRIMGRVRNMATRPDGGKIWPLLGLRKIRDRLPIKQFQAVQKTLHDVEVRLHVERPLTAAETAELAQTISASLGKEFKLSFAYFDHELPKGSNGKFEEFISLV